MTYHFSKTVEMPFDRAVAATTDALKKHGFGVLTQIDVKDTLSKKIGVDFDPILSWAHAIQRWRIRHLLLRTKSGRCFPAMWSCSNETATRWKSPLSIQWNR